MSTYKELIYMVSDLAKQQSDDTTLTERHIAFLLNKYRTYLLKQKYLNKAQEIPLSNYQTICADLQEVPFIAGCTSDCLKDDNSYLRSKIKITLPLTFSDTQVSLIRCVGEFTITIANESLTSEQIEYINYLFSTSFTEDATTAEINNALQELYRVRCKDDVKTLIELLGNKGVEASVVVEENAECNPDILGVQMLKEFSNVSMVNRNRFPYTGYSKYLKNQVYGTIGPDGYFYAKSNVENLSLYNKAFITTIFENPDKAYEQSSCTYKATCKNPNKISLEQIQDPEDEELMIWRYIAERVVEENVTITTNDGPFTIPAGSSYVYIHDSSEPTEYYISSPVDGKGKGMTYYLENEAIPTCTYDCPESDGIINCDPWDRDFPIEDALQTQLISLVLKDIYGGSLRPKDGINNANDDLSSIENFVRNAMKERYTSDNGVNPQ